MWGQAGNLGSPERPMGHLPQQELSPGSWAGTGSDTELLVGPAVPTENRLQQKGLTAVLGPRGDFEIVWKCPRHELEVPAYPQNGCWCSGLYRHNTNGWEVPVCMSSLTVDMCPLGRDPFRLAQEHHCTESS